MTTGEFFVVPGTSIGRIISEHRQQLIDIVRNVYLLHEDGQDRNPASCFLRLADGSADRWISLPGYVAGDVNRVGIKWIGSVPANLDRRLPRASAVLVLNDVLTGYPVACLEGSRVSAARTAASAALAATLLAREGADRRLACIGAGPIAHATLDFLAAVGFEVAEVACFDLNVERARSLARHASDLAKTRVAESLAQALQYEIILFATSAASPYVEPAACGRAGQLLLNISLRDLPPELLLRANNVVDDVDHCLRENTSPHLAQQMSGGLDFLNGTIGQAIKGNLTIDPDLPTVLSPFGLGVLDIGVGSFVFEEALSRGDLISVNDFFH